MTPRFSRDLLDSVYEFIVDYKRQHDGVSPSYREIAAACGLKGQSSVVCALNWLEEEGKIERNDGSHRLIRVPGGRWAMQAQPEAA